tara:strand:+ start:1638 stop:1811 length:174 start_codon:yes stop_codon:yes gene_type:complete
MSSSKNAKMITAITNPPTRERKMKLSDLFEKAKKKLKKMRRKRASGKKRLKKKTYKY